MWRFRAGTVVLSLLTRMLRPLSVLVVVFALGLNSCAVHTQLTEHQAKILFDSSDMDLQIYVMDPDGSHVRSKPF